MARVDSMLEVVLPPSLPASLPFSVSVYGPIHACIERRVLLKPLVECNGGGRAYEVTRSRVVSVAEHSVVAPRYSSRPRCRGVLALSESSAISAHHVALHRSLASLNFCVSPEHVSADELEEPFCYTLSCLVSLS